MEVCMNCGEAVEYDKAARVWLHAETSDRYCHGSWAPKPYSTFVAEPDLNDAARLAAENGD